MSDFTFLKPYVLPENSDEYFEENYDRIQQMKHSFLPVDFAKIVTAESRLGFQLPEELIDFYKQVGYGYMNQNQDDYENRFMTPTEVANAYLREGDFDNYYLKSIGLYDEPYQLLFFDNGNGTYLWLDLRDKGSISPVYYMGDEEPITKSVEDFALLFDQNPNFLKQVNKDRLNQKRER